jgi:germination protein YpeB
MENLAQTKSNISKRGVILLSVFVAVFAILSIVFCILYAVNKSGYETTSVNLENIYQRSFYDLVENVNNTEIKLGKLISSSDGTYSKRLLNEIHENTSNAQNNLSYLPVSMNGIPETVKFINQLSGYTSVLSKSEKSTLDSSDKETLNNLYDSVADVKSKLNEMSQEFVKGYSISAHSRDNKAEYTDFTTRLQQTKSSDVDYPTMIYDGPFSDSVVDKEIKGLNFGEVSEEDARSNAQKLFPNSDIRHAGDTDGRFVTYDYNISFTNGLDCYAQFTKKGGKLLTLSAYSDSKAVNHTEQEAIQTAEQFAKKQDLENMKCVWSDVVQNDAYINLAPVINNVIYYPDLIKVKVDLSTGNIVGWEATTYYTNHVNRTLPNASYSSASARSKIGSDFVIEGEKLALSPLDYNREVLTHEFKCHKDGDTYYFYINAQTGAQENILKVIKTDNGNLLM